MFCRSEVESEVNSMWRLAFKLKATSGSSAFCFCSASTSRGEIPGPKLRFEQEGNGKPAGIADKATLGHHMLASGSCIPILTCRLGARIHDVVCTVLGCEKPCLLWGQVKTDLDAFKEHVPLLHALCNPGLDPWPTTPPDVTYLSGRGLFAPLSTWFVVRIHLLRSPQASRPPLARDLQHCGLPAGPSPTWKSWQMAVHP